MNTAPRSSARRCCRPASASTREPSRPRGRRSALREGFEAESRATVLRLNVDFHEMLVGCADDSFFPEAVQRTNRLRRLIEYRLTADRRWLPRQSRGHLQSLDLIEAGNMPAAADFLFRHVARRDA